MPNYWEVLGVFYLPPSMDEKNYCGWEKEGTCQNYGNVIVWLNILCKHQYFLTFYLKLWVPWAVQFFCCLVLFFPSTPTNFVSNSLMV